MGETYYPLGRGGDVSEGQYQKDHDYVDEARDAAQCREIVAALRRVRALHFDHEGVIWRTRDGRSIPVRKLGDQHLENVISLLARNPKAQSDVLIRVLLAELNDEWNRRHNGRMKKAAKKTPVKNLDADKAPASLAKVRRAVIAAERLALQSLDCLALAGATIDRDLKGDQLAECVKALKAILAGGTQVRAKGIARAALKRVGEA